MPALQETLKSGRPTVVVVTSRSEPACAGFCRLLPEVMATQTVGNVVLLAEMSVEAYPERVQQLGVSRFPTILVYGKIGDQLALIDNRQGIADPYQATAWLDAMRQAAENQSTKPDPQVQNTQYATSQIADAPVRAAAPTGASCLHTTADLRAGTAAAAASGLPPTPPLPLSRSSSRLRWPRWWWRRPPRRSWSPPRRLPTSCSQRPVSPPS